MKIKSVLFLLVLWVGQMSDVKAAGIISVNFNPGGAGAVSGTEVVGLNGVQAGSWVNLNTASETDVAIDGAGATVTYLSAYNFTATPAGYIDGTQNAEMMERAIRIGGPGDGLFTVSGLGTEYTDPGYDVYVYFGTDNHTRQIRFLVGGVAVACKELLSSTWQGSFVEGGEGVQGNYAIASGLTASSFTITDNGTSPGKGGICGIEIVSSSVIPTSITVSETAGSTEVAEGGVGSLPQSDTFTLTPSREPAGTVTIDMTDQNNPDDVQISPNPVVLTPGDWGPQVVTVTAVDDGIVETDPETTHIGFSVSGDDTGYNGLNLSPLSVTVNENDCGAWGYQAGDADQNCLVNMADFAIFALDWLAAPTGQTDLDDSGLVDLSDLKRLAMGWLYCTFPNDPGCGKPTVLPSDTPNIILFLVDDMGWNDTSVEFHTSPTVWNELYQTPHMQTLADKGVKFGNAYAASPVCSPTRCSIMTGMNPAHNRISSWIGHGMPSNTYLNSPSWSTAGLQPNDGRTKLTTVLKDRGYRTIHVGKGHFGANGTSGADPLNLDFDVNRGGSHTGGPYPSYFSPWLSNSNYPNLPYPEGTYITDALTLAANEEIDQAVADGVPFYINMAHYAIHTPIGAQGDPDYLGQYTDRPNPEDDYAAMIESMDASLGSILANLEEEGIADNTLIIFFSDNGGLSNHTRNMSATYTTSGGTTWTFGKDTHNAPIKSGKGAGYEGGTRVPMIVAWAGQAAGAAPIRASLPIQPGTISDAPVISDDLFPTILQMAGVDDLSPYSLDIDGQDLTPVLGGTGTIDPDRPIVTHYPHQWYSDIGVGLGIEPYTSIRKGDWKLIYFYGDGYIDSSGYDPRFELYNLVSDIGETNNLAATNTAKRDELITDLRNWMISVGAQTPVSKATGQPVPLPAIP